MFGPKKQLQQLGNYSNNTHTYAGYRSRELRVFCNLCCCCCCCCYLISHFFRHSHTHTQARLFANQLARCENLLYNFCCYFCYAHMQSGSTITTTTTINNNKSIFENIYIPTKTRSERERASQVNVNVNVNNKTHDRARRRRRRRRCSF